MKEVITKVEGGKLQGHVSEAIRSWLGKFGNGLIKITIEEYKPGRSNQQNRYYWKVLVGGIKQYMADAGSPVSAEAIHHYIKQELCPDLCEKQEEAVIFGKKYSYNNATTTNMSTEDFNQLCERVRGWAAEQGLQLPLPHEQIYDQ